MIIVREEFPNTDLYLLWCLFSRILTEFSPYSVRKKRKCGQEKTPYLNTFHAVSSHQVHIQFWTSIWETLSNVSFGNVVDKSLKFFQRCFPGFKNSYLVAWYILLILKHPISKIATRAI